MPEDQDNSELGKLLHSTFNRASGLGSLENQSQLDEINNWGNVPGVTYDGGPQRQRTGPKGKISREVSNKLDAMLGGVDIRKYYPWCDPVLLNCWSRMLETTFRDFQITARPPSSVKPPFTARAIDAFPTAGIVTIAPAASVAILGFTMPISRFRGVITHAGQSAESAAAFSDLTWQIRINGTPIEPWESVPIQLWQMSPPTELCAPIQLQPQDVVDMVVTNGGGANHFVLGRLCGWFYPVRAETGDGSVRSTIVD